MVCLCWTSIHLSQVDAYYTHTLLFVCGLYVACFSNQHTHHAGLDGRMSRVQSKCSYPTPAPPPVHGLLEHQQYLQYKYRSWYVAIEYETSLVRHLSRVF